MATWHREVGALGGWVYDPGGVFFANPLDGDPAVRLRVDSEDFVVQPGTNIMFELPRDQGPVLLGRWQDLGGG